MIDGRQNSKHLISIIGVVQDNHETGPCIFPFILYFFMIDCRQNLKHLISNIGAVQDNHETDPLKGLTWI